MVRHVKNDREAKSYLERSLSVYHVTQLTPGNGEYVRPALLCSQKKTERKGLASLTTDGVKMKDLRLGQRIEVC